MLDFVLIGVLGPAIGIGAVALLRGVLPGTGHRPAVTARHTVPAAPRAPSAALGGIAPPAQAVAAAAPPARTLPVLTAADFRSVQPTRSARRMADWVVARHDNGSAPFFVIDKRAARVYVFQPNGTLVGTAPVLLGAARGDDSYPGIGNIPVPQVKPWQRTTPAGRFATQPGLDDEHHDIVWIDYDAAVAMHRVINKVRAEHRPERLASPDPKVRRISFGCVNVPIPFFENVVSPLFGKHPGVGYIIPEVRSFESFFPNDAPARAPSAVAQGAALQPAELR